MNQPPSDIIIIMRDLLALFESRCTDKITLRKLGELTTERERWPEAHALFREIRHKTLAAEKQRNEFELAQYAFEEICAKTLFNLSYPTAPFDADSAFWVLPLAVQLGRKLGISDPGDVTPLLKVC
jgi:hypothetical protein